MAGDAAARKIAPAIERGLNLEDLLSVEEAARRLGGISKWAFALDIDPSGIAEPEIEELLVAEIVHAFVDAVGEIGVGFVQAFYGGALDEDVLIFVAADFDGLGAAGIGDGDGGHLG